MYLHIILFNPFTLRPRYDVMRFFCCSKVLDEFLRLNISHETSLTGLFSSTISAFFPLWPLLVLGVKGPG